MSDADATRVSAPDTHDDHGHAPTAEPLGPVDVTAWVYTIIGALVGVIVALALWVARGG